jgi:hypothetical protein
MMNEIRLLIALITGIALLVRWRLFPLSWRKRVHNELHGRLKLSAPHLHSTFDSGSFDSDSSTSR